MNSIPVMAWISEGHTTPQNQIVTCSDWRDAVNSLYIPIPAIAWAARFDSVISEDPEVAIGQCKCRL